MMMRSRSLGVGVCAVAAMLVGLPAGTDGTMAADRQAPAAQQPPAGQPPAGQPPAGGQGRGRGAGGGGMRGAQPLNFEDRAGFESIFDGTMKGWDGDPAYWKAENGTLVGVSTEANPVKQNTFVIYQNELADFELKLEFRMNSTNSGVQFRSTRLPGGSDDGRGGTIGKWVLKGYQADIDFANQFTGMIYEERGRGFLMTRGQAVEIGADGSKKQIGSLEMTADELKSMIKVNDWNTVHLIARGNTLMNIVNGHVTAFIIDDDAKGRALNGLLGFQIHVGPPMKIEFRNIYVKKL